MIKKYKLWLSEHLRSTNGNETSPWCRKILVLFLWMTEVTVSRRVVLGSVDRKVGWWKNAQWCEVCLLMWRWLKEKIHQWLKTQDWGTCGQVVGKCWIMIRNRCLPLLFLQMTGGKIGELICSILEWPPWESKGETGARIYSIDVSVTKQRMFKHSNEQHNN